MGSLSGLLDGGISRYFRRRKYRRLHGDRRHQNLQAMRALRDNVGGSDHHGRSGPPRRRKGRFWRIRIVPKIVVRTLWSPSLKILARLRNAYLNAMINLAGQNGALNTMNVFGAKRIPKVREASPAIYSYNEAENRIALEIYKALKAYQPRSR